MKTFKLTSKDEEEPTYEGVFFEDGQVAFSMDKSVLAFPNRKDFKEWLEERKPRLLLEATDEEIKEAADVRK